MYTFGGRGGKIITVTNLNDDGEGSFRWACWQGGARIIVFNVSGIINLKTPLRVYAPYLTIAGQTAPGDGVCVAGESFEIMTHDVIIRHMRFRRGGLNPYRREDALGGNPVGNIIVDHCSCSWGLDENISIYRHMYDPGDGTKALKLPTANVTIQNTISSEALDTFNHAFGSTLGGTNNTFMFNLYACNAGRNPSMSASEFNFVNNVLFNWVHRAGDGSGRAYNVINNYLKPGPATPEGELSYRVFRANSKGPEGWAYVDGNYVAGNPEVTKDNWAGGVQGNGFDWSAEDLAHMRAAQPFPMAHVTILSAEEAYQYVLKNAGATLPKRDAVDERIMRQVSTGKIEWNPNWAGPTVESQNRRLAEDSYKQGIITEPDQMGGYPEYNGTPYKDSDGDGMPDEWEIKYGLNPNDPSDANKDLNGDGYTNIEKYINGIDPTKKTDWTNLENNKDTLTEKGKLI